MRIINTGGTFNKRYDPIRGELFVPNDDLAIETIMQTFSERIEIDGIIYKDSLVMNDKDRACLVDAIRNASDQCLVIVHGTDTMHLSAAAVEAAMIAKTVVFTGAMIPFSIDPIEATANLAMAIGTARYAPEGVYIAMQGVCGRFDEVVKNREKGKFEYVQSQM